MSKQFKLAPRWRRALTKDVASWCMLTVDDICQACDWYVVRDDGARLAMKYNGGDILFVAHMDFNGTGKVHFVGPDKVISSALDDRAGCAIAWNWQRWTGQPCDIVFTDYEECADSTLRNLGRGVLDRYRVIVQLDRRGGDAVVYGYTEMERAISGHFSVGAGSFSDICAIEQVSPVSAFNMGVGYHVEHTEKCYLDANETTAQIETLARWLVDTAGQRFEREADDPTGEAVDWHWTSRYDTGKLAGSSEALDWFEGDLWGDGEGRPDDDEAGKLRHWADTGRSGNRKGGRHD